MEYAERMKEIKSSSIREILKFTFQPGVISFAAGSPSPLTFPVEEFGEISKEIFASRAQEALQYHRISKIKKRLHFGKIKGFQRGILWHTTLLARYSVLYLLARLVGNAGV